MQAITFAKLGCLGMFLGLLLSCGRPGQFFFVKNQGAVMPVKVRGDRSSKNFVILLPGGPSGDGLVYGDAFTVFQEQLEPHLTMVYYDQRGAGNCQGTYDTTTLNLEQLSDDLAKLVQVLQHRYDAPNIFLLGYSYGGALGVNYLLDAERRRGISGLITVAGAFDRRRQTVYRERLIVYALDRWQEEGYIDSYAVLEADYRCSDQADVQGCLQDSIALQQKIGQRFREVEAYNQFPFKGGMIFRLLGYAFSSQSNPIASGRNEALHARYYQPEFDSLLLTDRAGEIAVPALIINGRWDTNVPFFDAEQLYQKLATPAGQKQLLILEKSGHLPMVTEPEALAEAIRSFVAGINR